MCPPAAGPGHPSNVPNAPAWLLGHLVVAPLWVAYEANLGTLLRTCDATGASLNIAVAGSLVLYRLAGLAEITRIGGRVCRALRV